MVMALHQGYENSTYIIRRVPPVYLFNKALFPYFSEIRGMDLSGQMVKEYNARAEAAGLSPKDMHATQGDLTASSTGHPDSGIESQDYFDFDLAIMNMALHHVDKPDVVMKKLVDRLKKRGVLVIVDLTLKGDPFKGVHGHGEGHGHEHGHGHRSLHGHHHESHQEDPTVSGPQHTISFQGFDKEQMEKYFTEAGCVETDYVEFERTTRIGDGDGAMTKLLFMARGRKGE